MRAMGRIIRWQIRILFWNDLRFVQIALDRAADSLRHMSRLRHTLVLSFSSFFLFSYKTTAGHGVINLVRRGCRMRVGRGTISRRVRNPQVPLRFRGRSRAGEFLAKCRNRNFLRAKIYERYFVSTARARAECARSVINWETRGKDHSPSLAPLVARCQPHCLRPAISRAILTIRIKKEDEDTCTHARARARAHTHTHTQYTYATHINFFSGQRTQASCVLVFARGSCVIRVHVRSVCVYSHARARARATIRVRVSFFPVNCLMSVYVCVT